VPVYDRSRGSFSCFLDMVDVVAFCVKHCTDIPGNPHQEDEQKLLHTPLFCTKTCGEVADLSRRNPFLPVESQAPLLEVISLMVNWGVHRIPVVDAEGEMVTILSQSRVVSFLYKYIRSFSLSLLHTPAAALLPTTTNNLSSLPFSEKHERCGCCRPQRVVTVRTTDRAIDGFITMHDNCVSAVAVVDEKGRITANLSASDVKAVGYDGTFITRLFRPIPEFLRLVAAQAAFSQNCTLPPTPLPTAIVTADSSFLSVVGMLVNRRIHRVYVVDDVMHPIGVIGYREILRAVECAVKAPRSTGVESLLRNYT